MSERIPTVQATDAAETARRTTPVSLATTGIYTRGISGVFQSIRLYSGIVLLGLYFLLPWLMWGDRQLVWFDLPNRQFHVFAMTFWPEDLMLLSWLLIICAFGLFLVTVFGGRIWCGYTCPQTVWTQIFMWIERQTEGERNARIKLDKSPVSGTKLRKKSIKHLLWLGIAWATGFTFVAYFIPARTLVIDHWTGQASLAAYAWIGLFTAATYLNAGWMREKVCIHMCPYARFQSVMFDKDTLIVAYDAVRGEPRGSRKRIGGKTDSHGDCIDCGLCVQVCPTGIDIRDGLQYECIQCALCIDACNGVMEKMGYARGLVRYASEHTLAGGKTQWLRPRLLGYGIAFVVMVVAFGYALTHIAPLEISVTRDRGALFTETKSGDIANTYSLHVFNKTAFDAHYEIELENRPGARLVGPSFLELPAGQSKTVVYQVQLPLSAIVSPRLPVTFLVEAAQNASINARVDTTFLGPDRR
ncbi:MAG: cytochrome c oxidase accessory protein CcoG [Litorivicinaceae bacterium]